jgi:hypothetical protein
VTNFVANVEGDMRLKARWRAVAWGLLAVMVLEGCATVAQDGIGGSGEGGLAPRGPRPGNSEWEALEDARRAEIESAVTALWSVVSEVREVGAKLEFTYWAEGGALTLLSLRRGEWGREPGGAIARESFISDMRELLSTYTEEKLGAVRLTLVREERRWRADYTTDGWDDFLPPMEAKAWPVRRVGVHAEVLERLATAGREISSRVWVPSGAQVRWNIEVALEDEWVRDLETRPPRSLPGGTSVRAAPETVGTLVNVLVPFTQGLGPRKVRLELEGTHIPGSGMSRWKVVVAEVVRPPQPEPENAEVALEYRAMHEQIQRRWREESREGLQYLGVFTLEQIALWVVGGVVARGAGLVLEAAAPTIARVLARGGTNAVGWFRSLLARAAPAEKQALAKLMAKAETQGLEALTRAERQELQLLFGRLEKLPTTPLNQLGGAKNALREQAQTSFYNKFHPGLDRVLRDANGARYDVHHRIPLEYAHRFPLRDINSEANLIAAARPVHAKINYVWARFRRAPRTPQEEEILQVEMIVNKNFGRWFNKLYDETPTSAESLTSAELRALEEVEALLARMR